MIQQTMRLAAAFGRRTILTNLSTFVATVGLLSIGCGEVRAHAADKSARPPVVSFPDIAGWSKTKQRTLPEGKGAFSIGYNSPSGIFVTAYVYTRGIATVPKELTSAEVKQEMARSSAAIQAAVKIGIYKSAKVETQGKTHLGGDQKSREALWKKIRIETKTSVLNSDLYITTYRNRFIKLRCSRETTVGDKGEKELQALLKILGTHLAK